MIAMILAAGRGERMMPLTKNTPKPLLKVGGITLIEHAINACKKSAITQIIINICHLGEQIQAYLGDGSKFGVQITYSVETQPLETAGGIIQALTLLGDKAFIVINSDVLSSYDLSTLKLPKRSLAHLVLIDNPPHNLGGDFGLSQQKPAKITLNDKKYTFSGIGIYHPKLFKSQPETTKILLSSLFKATIEKRLLSGEYFSGYWQDVGTPERLRLVNKKQL